ncbi:MAG TPA: four helix bundle protein [Gemmatirosa sp.]
MINLATAVPRPRPSPSPTPAAGYRLLRAWQRALDVAAHAHRLAHTFPTPEHATLAADLRRAGASVPAQIAAGNLAYDRAEHRRALLAAQTALAHVETLALLAERLGAAPATDVASLLAEAADTLRLVRGLARVVVGTGQIAEPSPARTRAGELGAPQPNAVRRRAASASACTVRQPM